MLQPLADRASLGERFAGAEAFGQIGEDRVIVPRLTIGRRNPRHRHQQGIVGTAADILALQRHGRGQHEIGVARGRGPAQFMHHQRIDLRESAPQAIEILMMMERVAAGPVDQADVGIGQGLAVVAIRAAGIEQHVGDAGDRDEFGDGVAALRQRRQRHRIVAASVIGDRAERVGVAAARQADLPQRRGEHGPHPDRLLAMFGALQRVRDHDQGAASVKVGGRAPRCCRPQRRRWRQPMPRPWAGRRSLPKGSARKPASRPYSGRGNHDRAVPRPPTCAPAPASARCRCRGCC